MARSAVPFGQTTADLPVGVVGLTGMAWPLHHPVAVTVAWSLLLLVLLVPLSTRLYRTSGR